MRLKQFPLGRVFGIPLIIDYSWPPVVLLHIWMVSRFWMVAEVQPPLPLWHNLIVGSVITALFFWLWLFVMERLSASYTEAQAGGAAFFYLAAANLFLAL